MAAFQEQLLSDVSDAITIRFAQFEHPLQPEDIPGISKGPIIV